MDIGITFDLRSAYLAAGLGDEETAEFDRESTIDAIEDALGRIGHRTERVGHVRQLVARLADRASWDLVFNIAEGLCGNGREAQVPALLDAYAIPYTFSDPLVSALTLHKAMTKRVLRDLGVPTPAFAVVATRDDLARLELEIEGGGALAWPLFVKPLAEGTAKGVTPGSHVSDRADLRRECERILAAYDQPALVEAFLPGREFTVGILGTGQRAWAIGTLEIVLKPEAEPFSYTYINKERCEELCEFPLAPRSWADAAEKLALAAWTGLGCRDGGRVDLRANATGGLEVLEINALPGLHPTHSDLPMLATAVGMEYEELIRRIVDSAAERTAMEPRVRAKAAAMRAAPATASATAAATQAATATSPATAETTRRT